MRDELGFKFHARMVMQSNAMTTVREKLWSIETHLESLIDDSNPNKDALAALKDIQSLVVQSRVIIEEANR